MVPNASALALPSSVVDASFELLRLRLHTGGAPVARDSGLRRDALLVRLRFNADVLSANTSATLACTSRAAAPVSKLVLRTGELAGGDVLSALAVQLETARRHPALARLLRPSLPQPAATELLLAARCERCEKIAALRRASPSLRGCRITLLGPSFPAAGLSLRPNWRLAGGRAQCLHDVRWQPLARSSAGFGSSGGVDTLPALAARANAPPAAALLSMATHLEHGSEEEEEEEERQPRRQPVAGAGDGDDDGPAVGSPAALQLRSRAAGADASSSKPRDSEIGQASGAGAGAGAAAAAAAALGAVSRARLRAGWSGPALQKRRDAASRLRSRLTAHHELQTGLKEMACRQRVVTDIAQGASTELVSLIAVGLGQKTMFVKMIFDALITPLIEILIYILVLLLIITVGAGAVDRMTYFMSWCMPIAIELCLAPPLSNVLCGLLTYCLRIAVGDGLNDELTRLMDAIMVGNLAQSMSLVVGPAIAHKVVALTAKPLTYATSRSLTVDITHALSHGLSHSVTHAIVHKYYCQYCFQYHEYCQVLTHTPCPCPTTRVGLLGDVPSLHSDVPPTPHPPHLAPPTRLLPPRLNSTHLSAAVAVLLLLQRLHVDAPALVDGRHRAHRRRGAHRKPVRHVGVNAVSLKYISVGNH